MKILCISDIHGHAERLARVLEVGTSQGCSVVLVAGDLCFPGPDPLKTWHLLTAAQAHCVQGISDLALATVDPDRLEPKTPEECERVDRLKACREELGELILARLAKLPRTFRLSTEDGGELLLVHGSPSDPTVAMTHEMSDEELNALIGDDPADVVICGASHVPFERKIGITHVVGVGSVGESPTPGTVHASLLETTSAGVSVRSLTLVLHSKDGNEVVARRVEEPKTDGSRVSE